MKNSNEKNEMLSVMINITTRVVTMIFIIVGIFALFAGSAKVVRFALSDIAGILLMGLVSGLAFGLFFIKKNLTKAQMIMIHVLYFLILNAVLLCIGLYLGWFEKKVSSLIDMEIMFVVVYVVVSVLVYAFDLNEAKKINKKLQDRKQAGKENM